MATTPALRKRSINSPRSFTTRTWTSRRCFSPGLRAEASSITFMIATAPCIRRCVRNGAAGARGQPERRVDLHPRALDGQLPRRRVAATDGHPRSRLAVKDPRRDARLAGHRRRRLSPPDRGNRREAADDAIYLVRVARRQGVRHFELPGPRFDPARGARSHEGALFFNARKGSG